jgi:hypothetical protein
MFVKFSQYKHSGSTLGPSSDLLLLLAVPVI